MSVRFETAPTSTASPESLARQSGQRRRQHDDESAARAQARTVDETDRRALCLQRWPGILASIRSLVVAYNDGAGRQLLTAADSSDGDDPAVTIASPGSECGSVTVAVDGSDLCVRTNGTSRSTAGPHGGVRRIDCSRSDVATAAYLLQDWMDRLSVLF